MTEVAVGIPLTQGFLAIIDEGDIDLVNRYAWCVRKDRDNIHRYATRGYQRDGRSFTQHMHQLIMGEKNVDHINGNGLDNRRINLRLASRSQNMGNTLKRVESASSQFKGVKWSKASKKWSADIVVNGSPAFLGYFIGEVDAAKAYDRAAREGFKQFAALNFPGPGERSAIAPEVWPEVAIAYTVTRPARFIAPACRNGHLYTPENTYRADGRRFCRTCRAAHARAALARKRLGGTNAA